MCATVCEEGKRRKNDNDEGAGDVKEKNRVSGLNDKIPNFHVLISFEDFIVRKICVNTRLIRPA